MTNTDSSKSEEVLKNLDTFKKVANSASEGPWVALEAGDEPDYWWVWQESKLPYYGGVAEVAGREEGVIAYPEISGSIDSSEQEKADAIHMATFDPPTVLTMLEMIEEGQGAKETLIKIEHFINTMLKPHGQDTVVAARVKEALLGILNEEG